MAEKKTITEMITPHITEQDKTMVDIYGLKSQSADNMIEEVKNFDSRYDDPGAKESYKLWSEHDELMFLEDSTPEQIELRETLLKALWKASGSPFLKTYPTESEDFRPHYGPGKPSAPDTLYIREGVLSDFMEESPHSYAYNQPEYGSDAKGRNYSSFPYDTEDLTSTDPSYDPEYRKEREAAALEEYSLNKNWWQRLLGGMVEDKSRYFRPGTVEYEAHEVLEPRFWDYMSPGFGMPHGSVKGLK